jgi:hypothetical protein
VKPVDDVARIAIWREHGIEDENHLAVINDQRQPLHGDVRRKRRASREGRCGWEDPPEYKRQVNQGPEYTEEVNRGNGP